MTSLIESRKELTILAVTGALSVALGAFGAHGLKPLLSETALHSYQTGVQYHFYHVLAMGLMVLLYIQSDNNIFLHSFYLFTGGILAFSGSLYLLSTVEISGISSFRLLGPVTPLGGLLFMLGWLNIVRCIIPKK